MGILKTAGSFISGDYKETAQDVFNLIMGWKFFFETEVVVGIPEESNVADGEGWTTAGLLYFHEQGCPAAHIPPRPVLHPALDQEGVREEIEEYMAKGAYYALVEGDVEQATECYEKAGMLGRDAVKDYITSAKVAPNAESTILRKGSSIPLIQYGVMFESINYAVRKKR